MVRIGVVGVGAWGLNHVRVIASEPRCSLVAIADPSEPARAHACAIVPGVRQFTDARDLVACPEIDAVVVASPATTHAAFGSAVLAAGKHLLVEKPMSMTVEQAAALIRARQPGCIGLVGHLMLYHPAVLRLRELYQSGSLGRLHYLHSTRVNLGRLRRDENALWSFGPHDLSMIDFLLDGQLPATVAARGQCVLQAGIEDVVFLTMRYATGEMGHVHLSWLNPRKERRLTLVCSQKMAEFDDVAADKLRIYDKGYDRPPPFTEYAEYLTLRDGDVHIAQVAMQEPLRIQLQHFIDCIEGEASALTDLESGLRVVRILETAQRSLDRDGLPMSIAV